MGVALGEPGRVLIVDDEALDRNALRRTFEHRDWDVELAANSAEAVGRFRPDEFDVVLVDINLGEESGLDLIGTLRESDPSLHIVVISGAATLDAAVEAVHRGATTCLQKPVTVEGMIAAIERAEKSRRHEKGGADSLNRSSRAHIQRVLAACGNNKSEAAKRLGIDRRSLQRKLSKSDG